jgi:hypothetical protein
VAPAPHSLDAGKLEGRHFGEASCREYRESVLHVLPHVWERPADTRLVEAHFVKHRVGRGATKHALAAASTAKGRGAVSARRRSRDGGSAGPGCGGVCGTIGTGVSPEGNELLR